MPARNTSPTRQSMTASASEQTTADHPREDAHDDGGRHRLQIVHDRRAHSSEVAQAVRVEEPHRHVLHSVADGEALVVEHEIGRLHLELVAEVVEDGLHRDRSGHDGECRQGGGRRERPAHHIAQDDEQRDKLCRHRHALQEFQNDGEIPLSFLSSCETEELRVDLTHGKHLLRRCRARRYAPPTCPHTAGTPREAARGKRRR